LSKLVLSDGFVMRPRQHTFWQDNIMIDVQGVQLPQVKTLVLYLSCAKEALERLLNALPNLSSLTVGNAWEEIPFASVLDGTVAPPPITFLCFDQLLVNGHLRAALHTFRHLRQLHLHLDCKSCMRSAHDELTRLCTDPGVCAQLQEIVVHVSKDWPAKTFEPFQTLQKLVQDTRPECRYEFVLSDILKRGDDE
jgi:hypothetical protein